MPAGASQVPPQTSHYAAVLDDTKPTITAHHREDTKKGVTTHLLSEKDEREYLAYRMLTDLFDFVQLT